MKQTTLTYGEDVSKGIMSVIGSNTALGETFHVTSSEAYYWKDILIIYSEDLEKTLGYKPKVVLQNTEIFLLSFSRYSKDSDILPILSERK